MSALTHQAERLRDLAALLAALPQLDEPLAVDVRGDHAFVRRGGGGPVTWADWDAWLVAVAASRPCRIEAVANPSGLVDGEYSVDLAIYWRHRGTHVEIKDSLHRFAEEATPEEADRRALDALDAFRSRVREARAGRRTAVPVSTAAGQADLFAGVS